MNTVRLLLVTIKILICLVFVLPLVVSPQTIFPFVVGKAIYSRILIEIIFGLWVIILCIDSRYRPKLSFIYIALLLYIAIVFITSIYGASFIRSFWSNYERMQGIYDLIHWVGFILVIVSVNKNWKDYQSLLIINSIVSIVVCLGAILNNFDIFVLNIAKGTQFTTGNVSYLAQYCTTSIFLACLLIIKLEYKQHTKWINSLCAVFIVLNLITLWIAASRASYLSLFVSLFVLTSVYLFLARTTIAKFIVYSIFGLLIFGMLITIIIFKTEYQFNDIVIADTKINADMFNNTFDKIRNVGDRANQQRIVAIDASVKSFYDKPFVGWGYENYLIAWGRYVDTDLSETFDTPHNKLLEVLVVSGMFGFGSYILIWVLVAATIVLCFSKTQHNDRLFISILGGTLLSFLINILFLFDTSIGMMQLSLLLSLSIYLEYKLNIFQRTKTRMYIFLKNQSNKIKIKSPLKIDLRIKQTAIIPVIIIFFVYSIIFIDVKQFIAANYMVIAATHTELNTRIYFYTKSSDMFSYLETYPVISLLKDILSELMINNRNGIKTEQASLDYLAKIIDHNSNAIIEKEPSNFIVYYILSYIYINLSYLNPIYFDDATVYKNRFIELAPNHPQKDALLKFYDQIQQSIEQQ